MDPEAAAVYLEGFETSVMLSWEATLDHPVSWPVYFTRGSPYEINRRGGGGENDPTARG
jgi:hypothetical protein